MQTKRRKAHSPGHVCCRLNPGSAPRPPNKTAQQQSFFVTSRRRRDASWSRGEMRLANKAKIPATASVILKKIILHQNVFTSHGVLCQAAIQQEFIAREKNRKNFKNAQKVKKNTRDFSPSRGSLNGQFLNSSKTQENLMGFPTKMQFYGGRSMSSF